MSPAGYGLTQIYLTEFDGTLPEAQALCRVWELRGFEVLSVANSMRKDGEGPTCYCITMRASTTLYVDWLMHGELYQAGPYDGQPEAEAAERSIIMQYGLDVVKDIYITAQRDHDRKFVGDPSA